MNDRRPPLYEPLTHIAVGYLLLHVNFNLGTLNILPDWLGYLLILSALGPLGRIVPSALLLRPLGRVLAAWAGLLWGMALLGREFSLYPLSLIITVISLYFHFQLLTDLASVARQFPGAPREETDPPVRPLDQRLLRLRTVRTLLITLLALPFPPALLAKPAVSFGILLVHFVVAVRIMAGLYELRRAFPPPPKAPEIRPQ